MNKTVEWLIVGKFGRVQGLKGFIKVVSFTEPKESIINYSPWYIKNKDCTQPIKLTKIEKNNKFYLVKVDGYEDRDSISSLTNCEILIKVEQLAKLPANEYYWHELVGMEVKNHKNVILGTVKDLIATGSNDVLVVKGNKRHLIPYIQEECVVSIDAKERRITVNWDEDF